MHEEKVMCIIVAVKGYLRKGNIHMAMKENDKASDAFQKALDIDSNCSVSDTSPLLFKHASK